MRHYGILLILTLLASPVYAVDVYVNGSQVDGALKDAVIQDVSVQFDAQGNLYINAPGYQVRAGQEGQGLALVRIAEPENEVSAQHWLVVNNLKPGHYRVFVKVNGSKVLDLKASRRQALTDVSGILRPGKNLVEAVYLPIPDAPAGAAADAIQVTVGMGSTDASGALTLRRILGTHTHQSGSKGAEAKAFTVDFKP